MPSIARAALLLPLLLTLGYGYAPPAPPDDEPVDVYRGATILTVSHGEIADGDLIVRGGKIIALGKRDESDIPDGARVHDLSGKLVIPGLVDTHSHIGIYPRPEIPANSDGNEMTGAVQSGLRALDAIYPDDPGIRMALAGGVTTANIMPGSGNAIGGQTLYVKLREGPIDHMMVQPGRPEGGLKMANGENPKRSYGPKNQPPGTRMRLAAMQREQFVRAGDYQRKWQAYREKEAKSEQATPPERDLALDTLVEVLERKRTVHFHTHRADDIMTVLRLADEFGFEVVVQHGTEAYRVADELARRHIPVSMTLPDSPGGKAEVADFLEQNGALLEKAGVKIAVNTDDFITESRFLLRTASIAVRGGLSEASALRAVTLSGAEMLHLERQLGSLDAGKDADFVVLSGRPFSVYTQVLATYIDGQQRYDRGDAAQAAYAVGGFALADPAARPPAVAAMAPRDRPRTPELDASEEVPADAPRIAVRAGVIHTAGGEPIPDGLVVVENGQVLYVGAADGFEIPEGTPLLKAAAVTPGLIDAHTVVGVSGRLNIPADQDQDELSDPNQADAQILDSFNPAEPLVAFALQHGVTIVQAFPGRANAIAGQAGIFRTSGKTVTSMTVRFPSAVVFNLGEVPKSAHAGKPPATRMGTAALIRNALQAAANYRDKQKSATDAAADRNQKHEALGLVLDKKVPAVFSAHRSDDLVTALRLTRDFQLRGVLDLATEAYLVVDDVAAAHVPVLVHPTMQRIGSPETMNGCLGNAARLADRGIPIAIGSAFEAYVPKTRVPLYEAAIAMANGLGYERAIRAITLDAARILGIDQKYGSLEKGKAGDLVLYDGDPFEYATHVLYVIMDGKVVYDRAAALKKPRGGDDGAWEMSCCEQNY